MYFRLPSATCSSGLSSVYRPFPILFVRFLPSFIPLSLAFPVVLFLFPLEKKRIRNQKRFIVCPFVFVVSRRRGRKLSRARGRARAKGRRRHGPPPGWFRLCAQHSVACFPSNWKQEAVRRGSVAEAADAGFPGQCMAAGLPVFTRWLGRLGGASNLR
jgi:hypothetical protein